MKKINSNQTPIYRDAGFYLENVEKTKKAFAEEKDHPWDPDLYIYSRYRNPTVTATEKHLAKLENSEWALLSPSGMAAIDIALSIFQKGSDTGKWLFFSEIYGGTNSFIELVLKQKRGLQIERFVAQNGSYDLDVLRKTLELHKPELVYFEAVSNPMLIVADAIEIINICKSFGAKVIIDNTFLTPYLWKPLEAGADLVIHSATKYLAGHGNLTAGVVCGNNPDWLKELINYRKWVGHIISPDDAYRLNSFLKSIEIRFKQHCSNAFELAKILESHPKISQVLYPGLKNHPTYQNAMKLTDGKGFGGMLTFEIAGKNNVDKAAACNKFIHHISNQIPLVPTLGDADTILLPIEAVWGDKYPFPGMIRLSVGIENIEELTKAILIALDKV